MNATKTNGQKWDTILAWILGSVFFGCGGGQKPIEYRDTTRNFVVFGEATTEGGVPFLVRDGEREDIPCFEPYNKPEFIYDDGEASELVGENGDPIGESVLRWYLRNIAPAEVPAEIADSLSIDVASLVTLKVPLDSLYFQKHQKCVHDDSMWLPPEIRVVATLFGTQELRLNSTAPISDKHCKKFQKAARKKKAVVEYKKPPVFKPIYAKKRKQKIDENGEKLFRGPNGQVVTENQLPDPEEILLRSWTVRLKKPVFFGYRELSGIAWKGEYEKEECNQYLVWNDAVFRKTECPFFEEIGFAIGNYIAKKKGKKRRRRMFLKGDKVLLKVKFDDEDVIEVTGKMGQKTRFEFNKQTIIWITPVPEEEGATIKVSGVVLDPRTGEQKKKSIAADGSIM
jgi:hypothetical protein